MWNIYGNLLGNQRWYFVLSLLQQVTISNFQWNSGVENWDAIYFFNNEILLKIFQYKKYNRSNPEKNETINHKLYLYSRKFQSLTHKMVEERKQMYITKFWTPKKS